MNAYYIGTYVNVYIIHACASSSSTTPKFSRIQNSRGFVSWVVGHWCNKIGEWVGGCYSPKSWCFVVLLCAQVFHTCFSSLICCPCFLLSPDLRCWFTNCRWCQLRCQRSVGALTDNQLLPNASLECDEKALIDLVDGLSLFSLEPQENKKFPPLVCGGVFI
jgi:hypothetical protein